MFQTDAELACLDSLGVHREAQTVITSGNNFSFVYTGNSLVCDGQNQCDKMTQTFITGKVSGDIFTN